MGYLFLVNTCDVHSCVGVRKVSNSQSGTQGHSRLLILVPFDRTHVISYLSSAVSLSCTVYEILAAYFPPNFKRLRDPECTPILHNFNMCNGSTLYVPPANQLKFEMSSFMRSKIMAWVPKSATFGKWLATFWKRYKTDTQFLLKSNRKPYAVYRMGTLPMTLSDL